MSSPGAPVRGGDVGAPIEDPAACALVCCAFVGVREKKGGKDGQIGREK